MPEIVINLHMHTCFSDGTGTHEEIAEAALKAGLDAVIITDHNVFVKGPEGYYHNGKQRLLLLVGEEIHDRTRIPQKSHLLVLGAGEELASLSGDLDQLIKAIKKNDGLAFVAHPSDPEAPAVGEPDLSWVDWQVQGLDGLEIWNGFSEFKSLLKTKLHAIYYAYNPERIAHGPFPETLRKWDEMLGKGDRMFAIGGSDAHALKIALGPLHRTIFPYEYHFRSINTHLICDESISGDIEKDRKLIYKALKRGSAFIGNDRPASTRGFNYVAHGYGRQAQMGEEISAERGITFQIRLPSPADCRLVRGGEILRLWRNQERCTYITNQPGAYRVEAYIPYKGRYVGWIFSNPIFIR
jgi:hypothetical protein